MLSRSLDKHLYKSRWNDIFIICVCCSITNEKASILLYFYLNWITTKRANKNLFTEVICQQTVFANFCIDNNNNIKLIYWFSSTDNLSDIIVLFYKLVCDEKRSRFHKPKVAPKPILGDNKHQITKDDLPQVY